MMPADEMLGMLYRGALRPDIGRACAGRTKIGSMDFLLPARRMRDVGMMLWRSGRTLFSRALRHMADGFEAPPAHDYFPGHSRHITAFFARAAPRLGLKGALYDEHASSPRRRYRRGLDVASRGGAD